MCLFFPGGSGDFLLLHWKQNFNERMSTLAGLRKEINQLHAKVPILAIFIFDWLGPPSKSIFSTYRQNFIKPLKISLAEVVRNIVSNFEPPIISSLRRGGASRFASRNFLKSVVLPSAKNPARPFVACHACSIVFFIFSNNKFPVASIKVHFYWLLVD